MEEQNQAPVEVAQDSIVTQGEKIAARIEAANKQAAELLAKNTAILDRMILGGRSEAGQATPKVETPDEKWEREAKIRYAGTGMDPTPRRK